ncbi:metal ABC transporter permease [Patescibacteria group bacterium]|nr:metal ABC transporter permease [Patescibacteria group bacterium]
MIENALLQNIIIGVAVSVASSFIGAFIILKRMSLVGDALSHVALPGLALGIFFGVNPFWGALLFLLVASAAIWRIESYSRLPADAIAGILFTASLAFGMLLIPNQEILESLFGNFVSGSLAATVAIVAASFAILACAMALSRRFVFRIISADLSDVYQKTSRWDDLFFLLLFAVAVALGIKLVGTLLMGALTVIPAAAAKNMSRTMRGYILLSVIIGILMSAAGILFAAWFGIAPGPVIILVGVGLFLVSLAPTLTG